MGQVSSSRPLFTQIMTWISMTDYYYLQAATLDSGPQINLSLISIYTHFKNTKPKTGVKPQ